MPLCPTLGITFQKDRCVKIFSPGLLRETSLFSSNSVAIMKQIQYMPFGITLCTRLLAGVGYVDKTKAFETEIQF